MRFCRIKYSKSLPSSLAIAAPLDSGFQVCFVGLAGADRKDSSANASWSVDFCNVDMAISLPHQNGCLTKAKQGYLVPAVYIMNISHDAPGPNSLAFSRQNCATKLVKFNDQVARGLVSCCEDGIAG